MVQSFMAFFFHIMGGKDDILETLIFLNIIDICVLLLSNQNHKLRKIKNKLKIYIVIALGVAIDKFFHLDGNPVTRFRTYLIISYAYNEVLLILNELSSDKNFFIPIAFKTYLSKLKHKHDNSIITGDDKDESKIGKQK